MHAHRSPEGSWPSPYTRDTLSVVTSEFAEKVQDRLRQVSGGKACCACLGAALSLDRWDVLKGIRELILAGVVLAEMNDCGVCHRSDLVARLFPPSRRGSRR